MRIAFLIPTLDPGGAERVAATLCNAWCAPDAGHEVHLITYAAADSPSAYPLSAPVRVHPLDLTRPSPGLTAVIRNNVRRIRTVAARLREIRPDILLCFMTEANVIGVLAARRAGVPTVISERTDPRRHKVPALHRIARRLVYPLADSLTVQTDSVAGWYRRAHRLRSTVIANPINFSVFHPPADVAPVDRPHRIVSVGRLDPGKAFDVLIDAVAGLSDAAAGWTLSIIGEGPERASLEAQIARLGLQDRVVLHGPSDRVADMLREASVYATATRYEGFPNAVMEALASGLCVVASDAEGAMRDLLRGGEAGILVPVGDAQALTSALERVMRDVDARTRFMQAGVDAVRPLSDRHVAAQWIAHFEAVRDARDT